jgi:protease IV
VDQFGGLDDALGWVAQQARLKDGSWHPVFLGQETPPYAALIDRLRGDDEGGAPADLAGLVAERQRGLLARALGSAEALLGTRGAQAYCLECPVLPRSDKAVIGQFGLLARIVKALGIG